MIDLHIICATRGRVNGAMFQVNDVMGRVNGVMGQVNDVISKLTMSWVELTKLRRVNGDKATVAVKEGSRRKTLGCLK